MSRKPETVTMVKHVYQCQDLEVQHDGLRSQISAIQQQIESEKAALDADEYREGDCENLIIVAERALAEGPQFGTSREAQWDLKKGQAVLVKVREGIAARRQKLAQLEGDLAQVQAKLDAFDTEGLQSYRNLQQLRQRVGKMPGGEGGGGW